MFYVFLVAIVVLSLAGCGGHSHHDDSSTSNHKLMVISSPALEKGKTYKIYKDSSFMYATSPDNPMYYVTPVTGSRDVITMNLEFEEGFSNDAFVIVDSDDNMDARLVIFGYNPNGSGADLTSEHVMRQGASAKLQKYTNLELSESVQNSMQSSAIDLGGSDEEILIVLSSSDNSATVGGTKINPQNYVWHIAPDYPDEYWTLGDSTTKLTKSEMLSEITSTDGVYIARDVRYTPDTLNFTTSNTMKKDEDTEYVVYYDATASEVYSKIQEIVADYGSEFSSDKYVLASLPSQVAGTNGGAPTDGGTPPDGGDGGTPPSAPAMMTSDADTSIPAVSTMTHSASEAYNNPVLHITQSGVYRLRGTWNGQIWIEVGEAEDDKVALILDGVTVNCTVAPALVFKEVYECGPDTETDVSNSEAWKTLGSNLVETAGAIVQIADGTTNTFTGANVYRIMKLKIDDDDVTSFGSDIGAQKKMYKLDGAFHSRMSMAVGSESTEESGTLNVISTTYEGLDSELHLLIESGKINISAPDDGSNVNEDYISVFTMDSGDVKISSTGGDGIDSNGYVVVNNGTLTIAAGSQSQNSAGEAGIDAESGVYISDSATYNWYQAGTDIGNVDTNPVSGDQTAISKDLMQPVTLTNSEGIVVLDIRFSNPESDDEGSRTIPSESNLFKLEHRVNNFSGVRNDSN